MSHVVILNAKDVKGQRYSDLKRTFHTELMDGKLHISFEGLPAQIKEPD
jgi:hypothetical protein